MKDRERIPKRRVTIRRQDRHIALSHLRDRVTTAVATSRMIIGNHQRNISAQTVRNRLREVGLRARRHLRFTRADWANVLFTDETRFNLRRSDGRLRVYRRRGERYSAPCVKEKGQFGGGSVMIWAGISLHTQTQAVVVNQNLNAQRYQDLIIRPCVIPHVQANRGMMFMQDNAPCHTARTTRGMLQRNNIRVLDWPPCSPDLNPIENLWDEVDRRIRRLPAQQNLVQLQRDILNEWNNAPQRFLHNYINSMRQRCLAVIRANGGHTRY